MTDPRRRLDHILARCDEAAQFGARGRDEFETDVILRHAAKSIIADIGEAAKNLDDLADQIPLVPWTQIARMRDRVAHRYSDVHYGVVRDTLTTDLQAGSSTTKLAGSSTAAIVRSVRAKDARSRPRSTSDGKPPRPRCRRPVGRSAAQKPRLRTL